jgi:LacI family transcriptional regulator
MRATIKDVAKKSNVSIATVSLVINNNKRISHNTRKKVLKAIDALGYQPSRSARDLVSRKSGNIGFILTEDHFLKTEPFYTQIFLGAEFEARQHPYYVLLSMISADSSQQNTLPRFVLENSVDGIIIAGKVPEELITNLDKYSFPVVFVDYYPSENGHAAVLIDNLNGGMQATQHLIDCGHSKIAFIGGDMEHPSIRDRFQGYKMALEKKGLSFSNERVINTEIATSRENGYSAASTLLKKDNQITAIFACNDAMAIGAMQYFKEIGLQIPADISIIGFDDVQMDILVDPPLTTMQVPKVDMGSEAMRLISEILDHKINGTKKILMPVNLILRNSTCKLEN